MRPRFLLLLIAMGLVGGWFTYKYWWTDAPTFPTERTLTDQYGRTVEARILARNELEVRFVRMSDGVEFRYPIVYLSDDDQAFLEPYPASRLGRMHFEPTESAGPTEREILLEQRNEIGYKLKLVRLDLSRQRPGNSGNTEGELRHRLMELEDALVDVNKKLLELAHREESSTQNVFGF